MENSSSIFRCYVSFREGINFFFSSLAHLKKKQMHRKLRTILPPIMVHWKMGVSPIFGFTFHLGYFSPEPWIMGERVYFQESIIYKHNSWCIFRWTNKNAMPQLTEFDRLRFPQQKSNTSFKISSYRPESQKKHGVEALIPGQMVHIIFHQPTFP